MQTVSMKSEVLVVLCTFPDEGVARQIGAVLIEKQVAACVNLLPPVRSIYRWEGKVEDETEVLAVIKTTAEGYAALEAALLELHPYDTPEVIAVPGVAGSEAYLRWVSDSVGAKG